MTLMVKKKCFFQFSLKQCQEEGIPNSNDCWFSIPGSGSDASFLVTFRDREPWNPGTRNPGTLEPGTLEPWNLLLGCNAMSMQLFHETMTRAIRDTKEFWWLRLVGGWRVDGNGLVLPGGHVFVATLQMRVALGGIGGWQYVFFSSDHCLQCHVSSLHTQNG